MFSLFQKHGISLIKCKLSFCISSWIMSHPHFIVVITFSVLSLSFFLSPSLPDYDYSSSRWETSQFPFSVTTTLGPSSVCITPTHSPKDLLLRPWAEILSSSPLRGNISLYMIPDSQALFSLMFPGSSHLQTARLGSSPVKAWHSQATSHLWMKSESINSIALMWSIII